MPITSRWYDEEETILLQTIKGHWSVDDFVREMHDQYDAFLNDHPDVRCFMLDMREADRMPSGFLARQAEWQPFIRENTMTAVVGAFATLRIFATALAKLGVIPNTVFVDTFEEAEQILYAYQREWNEQNGDGTSQGT